MFGARSSARAICAHGVHGRRYPLLRRDGLALPYFALLLLYALCVNARVPRRWRRAVAASAAACAAAHALHAFGDAPARYPDLWDYLITALAAGHFALLYIASTVMAWHGDGGRKTHTHTA